MKKIIKADMTVEQYAEFRGVTRPRINTILKKMEDWGMHQQAFKGVYEERAAKRFAAAYQSLLKTGCGPVVISVLVQKVGRERILTVRYEY